MSNVEEWARLRAEEVIPAGRDREFVGDGVPHAERIRYADGLSDMAALLLSDETVSVMAEKWYDNQTATWGKYRTSVYQDNWDALARAALQAALDKITEETE